MPARKHRLAQLIRRLTLPALLSMASACLSTVDFGDAEAPSQPRSKAPRETVLQEPVSVLEVKDGDTIVVDVEGIEETVRLKGIDTPELFPEPAEPFAVDAKNFTLEQVGAQVELQFDSGCPEPAYETCRDAYDRLLAYVRLSDGSDLGEALLAAGLARVFVFEGEPFDKQQNYESIEAEARNSGRGLWGS
mgnify:CR=1 FL=1